MTQELMVKNVLFELRHSGCTVKALANIICQEKHLFKRYEGVCACVHACVCVVCVCVCAIDGGRTGS
jgi:hypothetical protein